MRALALAALCCLSSGQALAAEDTSRSYAKQSCTERNANPNDCIIQNGPPPRYAVPVAPPAPPKSTPAGASSNGVTILGK